jgi:FG-GAP repeat/Bacterial Ig domain
MNESMRLSTLASAIRWGIFSGVLVAGGAQAAAVYPLSGLDGNGGFRIDGPAMNDYAGTALTAAGDINGDGIDDIVVGAHGSDFNGSASGSSYVVFGRTGNAPFGLGLNLSTINGSNGFRLDGDSASFSGRSVAGVGDVNGDGIDDLLIGAHFAAATGISHVVFGRAVTTPFASSIHLSSLNGSNGFRLVGAAFGDNSGLPVAAAGDVNGDGINDMLIGAVQADPNGSNSGSTYVVFGRAATLPFAASIDLSALNGSNGFRLDGVAALNYSGYSVAAAGDVNGDGIDDLIIGAHRASPNGSSSGSSYIVFGRSGQGAFAATIGLSTLNGSSGFRLDGAAAGHYSGRSVAGAGDVNGDGLDDIIIGASGTNANGGNSGSSYVMFGRSGILPFASVIGVSSLVGSNGFRLDGVGAGDRSGTRVAAAGDVNGDGLGDVIIGAYAASPNGTASGSSYVAFGVSGTAPFPASTNLSTLNGATGFRLDGVAVDDRSGLAVGTAGDVNGDGLDDLVVGAHRADPNGTSSGSSYVVFGNAPPLVSSSGPALTQPTLEDLPNPVETPVNFLVAPYYLDIQPLAGAAITSSPSAVSGTWQFRMTSFGAWNPVPASGLSSTTALVLGSAAELRFVPAPDFWGNAPTLTLRVWDGADSAIFGGAGAPRNIQSSIHSLGGFANDLNLLQISTVVVGVNDAPSFIASDPAPRLEDSGEINILNWASFSPGPPNESAQTPTYLVGGPSNPGLFSSWPQVNVSGRLNYVPAADAFGSSTFLAQVEDSSGTLNGGVNTSPTQTFTITMIPVNDAPSIAASNPAPVSHAAGAIALSDWAVFSAGPANEADQSALEYLVSAVSNPGLFASVPVLVQQGNNGRLQFTPLPGALGSSTFEVRVRDSGGVANSGVDLSVPRTFTINIVDENLFQSGFESP